MIPIILVALLGLPSTTPASDIQAPAAPADSLRAGEPTWWGPWPARSDSNSARFLDRPLPLWEKTVLVPHFLAGLPFRLIHHTTEATLTYMDNLGWFELPPTRHMGLALPWGGYLMPSIAASGLEGVTTGLSILRPNLGGPENRAYVKGSISTRHAEQLAGGMYLKLGPKTGLQLGGGLAEMSKMLYYGLGPSSDIGARSYYERISAWGGLEIDHLLGRGVRADFMTFFSQVRVTESEDEPERSISLVHDGRLPFGFPGESSGWTVRLGLLRNTTHENGRPAEGNFSRISADYFHASDGSDLRYLRYHASHEQFFPLWLTERTLGLRAFFNRIQNTGTLDVPFSRLVAFSRPDELRGFSSMRFSGLGSLGFSGEYRWPVWMRYRHGSTGVDGYLFCETGQVFNRRQEITLPNFEITGGFGFRLVSAEGKFVGRIEMGFSDEETVFSLSLGQNFQRDRRGLLYGKDPTRKR